MPLYLFWYKEALRSILVPEESVHPFIRSSVHPFFTVVLLLLFPVTVHSNTRLKATSLYPSSYASLHPRSLHSALPLVPSFHEIPPPPTHCHASQSPYGLLFLLWGTKTLNCSSIFSLSLPSSNFSTNLSVVLICRALLSILAPESSRRFPLRSTFLRQAFEPRALTRTVPRCRSLESANESDCRAWRIRRNRRWINGCHIECWDNIGKKLILDKPNFINLRFYRPLNNQHMFNLLLIVLCNQPITAKMDRKWSDKKNNRNS